MTSSAVFHSSICISTHISYVEQQPDDADYYLALSRVEESCNAPHQVSSSSVHNRTCIIQIYYNDSNYYPVPWESSSLHISGSKQINQNIHCITPIYIYYI
ncbi:unnamed protein product [Meganyctiphanes norvegica]|uniref:Uncharacterized protein n=1 Tax=Meganyctiphanes norvegica TaxID=48144 RepID=A0AAV2QG30_MEGNR